MNSFRLSTDRKTTPHARPRKGKGVNGAEPLANAFGLPSGPDYSCENATEWCWPGTCYANKLEIFPGVRDLLAHNWSVYQENKPSSWALCCAMDDMLDNFEQACVKRRVAPVFRWFWDGDIPSREFAMAMRKQAEERRHVQFWVYTRNFEAARNLLFQHNLTVYLSVDNCNVDAALEMHNRYQAAFGLNKPIKYAFCADTWEETEDLAARFEGERTGPRCPELTGKFPLVVWGKEGTGRGACVECGMCLTGINNVRFSSQKG